MTRKIILSGFMIIFFTINAFSQDKMVVDKPYGITYYDDFSKEIKSLKQLPPIIQGYVKKFMGATLGDFSTCVTFERGQIVNLKKYFSAVDNEPYCYQWIVPKYDLIFTLKDTSLGIKNYPINLRIDEYGQIIKINWPRKGFTEKSSFNSRDTIKTFALKKAAKLNLNQKGYRIDFEYDERLDIFYWIFQFPTFPEYKGTDQYYDCIEINWANYNDFKVYKDFKITVN
jgi:hypothetical protein